MLINFQISFTVANRTTIARQPTLYLTRRYYVNTTQSVRKHLVIIGYQIVVVNLCRRILSGPNVSVAASTSLVIIWIGGRLYGSSEMLSKN